MLLFLCSVNFVFLFQKRKCSILLHKQWIQKQKFFVCIARHECMDCGSGTRRSRISKGRVKIFYLLWPESDDVCSSSSSSKKISTLFKSQVLIEVFKPQLVCDRPEVLYNTLWLQAGFVKNTLHKGLLCIHLYDDVNTYIICWKHWKKLCLKRETCPCLLQAQCA